jgi:hypothetical protein
LSFFSTQHSSSIRSLFHPHSTFLLYSRLSLSLSLNSTHSFNKCSIVSFFSPHILHTLILSSFQYLFSLSSFPHLNLAIITLSFLLSLPRYFGSSSVIIFSYFPLCLDSLILFLLSCTCTSLSLTTNSSVIVTEVVLSDFKKVINLSQEIGVELNFNKCKIFCCSGDIDLKVIKEFQNLAPGIKICDREGLSLLGSPIFDQGFKNTVEKTIITP